MSVINVEHISKLYGDKLVLEDLSCSVDEGDKIGIIGINGTGKSTLLRIIAGEEEADEGKIIFSNMFVKEKRSKKIMDMRVMLRQCLQY